MDGYSAEVGHQNISKAFLSRQSFLCLSFTQENKTQCSRGIPPQLSVPVGLNICEGGKGNTPFPSSLWSLRSSLPKQVVTGSYTTMCTFQHLSGVLVLILSLFPCS